MMNMLHPGTEVLQGYRLTRFLGRGGFGEVWEAVAPGGVSKAIKFTHVERIENNHQSRELEGLQRITQIRHPYLLSIERFEIIGDFLVVVMELADMNLADRYDECAAQNLPGVPRKELLTYLREAAEVLDVFNRRYGLQHLDVKPENLFLLSGHVKVADFGLVQSCNSILKHESIAITPPYAPPELFDSRIEPTADQYSLAVTYQELLTGYRPFSGTDVRTIAYQHLREGPDLSVLPPADRPIIRKALDKDPARRFTTCLELIEALEKATETAVFHRVDVRPHPLGVQPVEYTPAPVPANGFAKPPSFLRRKMRRRDKTTAISTTGIRTISFSVPHPPGGEDDELIQVSFVAFLPLEIFAYKLRGFFDTLGGDVLTVSDARTVIRFRARGLFIRRGLFLQIDTYARNPTSGYRVVEATVWSNDENVHGQDLARRAMLIIRYLRAHMMASDKEPLPGKSAAEIRAEILG